MPSPGPRLEDRACAPPLLSPSVPLWADWQDRGRVTASHQTRPSSSKDKKKANKYIMLPPTGMRQSPVQSGLFQLRGGLMYGKGGHNWQAAWAAFVNEDIINPFVGRSPRYHHTCRHPVSLHPLPGMKKSQYIWMVWDFYKHRHVSQSQSMRQIRFLTPLWPKSIVFMYFAPAESRTQGGEVPTLSIIRSGALMGPQPRVLCPQSEIIFIPTVKSSGHPFSH